MKKKYLNLTGIKMNLQITRYSTMPVGAGIGIYESEIAEKFPSIFEFVEEKEDEIPVEEVIQEKEDEIPVEEVIQEKEDEIPVDEINYARFTYKKLKDLVKKKNLVIEGRYTSRKMIIALEACNK